MSKVTKDIFKNVIDGLLAGAKKEAKEKYADIIAVFKGMEIDEYEFKLRYPLDQCITGAHETSAGAFIFGNYNYVENAFSKLIKNREGSACSVDKSRHIVKSLYRHYETGEEVNFERKEDKQYWKVKTLTTEQCIEFFKAVRSAHYGDHEKLFQFYINLKT